MDKIYNPYVEKIVANNPSLPKDQKSVLLLDIYPVHIGEPFRTYVRETYPNVLLTFIPGKCKFNPQFLISHVIDGQSSGTGVFQPADVGLNLFIKQFLKQRTLEFLVESYRAQLASGLQPEQVAFTQSLPVLRNASVQPIVDVYNILRTQDGSELIKKVI